MTVEGTREETSTPTQPVERPRPPAPVRYLVTALAVAVYMALGFVLNVGATSDSEVGYLVLGIPIMLLFQTLVSRRPIRALWVRDARPFQLDPQTIGIGVLLAIAPAVVTVQSTQQGQVWETLYGIAGIGGAFAAAYALRAMRGTTVRQLLYCLGTAGAIGIVVWVVEDLSLAHLHHQSPLAHASLLTGVGYFLLYVPIIFVVEEVFFRGMLDTYLHDPAAGTGWLSAIFLSFLWGEWHVPLLINEGGAGTFLSVLPLQLLMGVPLSIWWRRSGNLMVPGTAHALSDAVRNALGFSV
jgi:hypothetical protein